MSCLSLGLLLMNVLTGLMLRLKNSCEHTASFYPYQNQKSPEDLLYIFAKAIRLKVLLALRGKLFSKNVLRDRVKLDLSALTDFLKDHRLSLTEENQ